MCLISRMVFSIFLTISNCIILYTFFRFQLFMSDTNVSSIDQMLYPLTMLDSFDAKSNRWTCDCRLLWLASYLNNTFADVPETLIYYR